MSRPLSILLAIVAIVIILPVIVLFALSSHSNVQFDPAPKMIGSATPLKVKVVNPHGVRHVRVVIEQGGVRTQVYESNVPATRLFFFGKHEAPRDFYFNAGSRTDGTAKIIAEVTSNDFRGATD